jgi:hypothetical protein
VSVLRRGSRTGNPVGPWPCDRACLGGAGAFPGLLSLAGHLPLLLSATTRANKQRPFAPRANRPASPGSSPKDRASCARRYYERLRLRSRPLPPRRSNRLARQVESEVCFRSSAPLSPLYLWLTIPTCLPRRPRRRWQRLTIIYAASIGLHPCARDSATPVVCHVEAHWLWFIFIQAHRFFARTAYSPPHLAGGQAPGRSVVNRPIRRVGLKPTSATTFTGCCGASCHRSCSAAVPGCESTQRLAAKPHCWLDSCGGTPPKPAGEDARATSLPLDAVVVSSCAQH